jgi:hypothetical protein
MVGEIVLAALAEAIFGILLENAAQHPSIDRQLAKIRGPSPEKRAIAHALGVTFRQFGEKYPQLAASLFDEHFLQQPGIVAELAKPLLPGRQADVAALDAAWRQQFSNAPDREIAPAITFFVTALERAYKDQPTLLRFTDSRNLDNIAGSSAQTAGNTGAIAAKLDVLIGLQERNQVQVSQTSPVHIQQFEPGRPAPAHQTPIAPNPFTDTGRINDPERFFGRRRILRDVQQALRVGNSISVVGDAQVGKYSLLYYLFATQASWQPGRPVLFLNMQSIVDEQHFCCELLERHGRQVVQQDLRTLHGAFKQQPAILLLDEIERLRDNDFRPYLQDFLRGIVDDGYLTLVAASHASLMTVFPPRDQTSPLHNAFTEYRLQPFPADEARGFLTARLENTGLAFSESEVAVLLAQSGGNPGQLQRAARTLYAQKSEAR